MDHGFLTLKQAALHVHIDERDLLHFAQRGEVPAQQRGDEFVFEHRLLDEWMQRHLLDLSEKKLKATHAETTTAHLRNGDDDLVVSRLLERGAIADIASKARGGVIRDMADLADATGLIYDPETYYRELVAREDAASTALDCGAALLHAKFHDPYHASDSFIAIGRTHQGVFFGASNDEPTDIFFLICCTDDREHMHVLARLATLVTHTELLQKIREAADVESIHAAIIDCEKQLVEGMK